MCPPWMSRPWITLYVKMLLTWGNGGTCDTSCSSGKLQLLISLDASICFHPCSWPRNSDPEAYWNTRRRSCSFSRSCEGEAGSWILLLVDIINQQMLWP